MIQACVPLAIIYLSNHVYITSCSILATNHENVNLSAFLLLMVNLEGVDDNFRITVQQMAHLSSLSICIRIWERKWSEL